MHLGRWWVEDQEGKEAGKEETNLAMQREGGLG